MEKKLTALDGSPVVALNDTLYETGRDSEGNLIVLGLTGPASITRLGDVCRSRTPIIFDGETILVKSLTVSPGTVRHEFDLRASIL